MKRLSAVLALILLSAAPGAAQKGPNDELGFHAEKLYDFHDIDSVNLFNGNLMVTVPIGPRYSVSSTLSYGLTLMFNGKVWDNEYWNCQDIAGHWHICAANHPNLRSNAGIGWRVSLGRLIEPGDTTLYALQGDRYMYEGPSGDEHTFRPGGAATPELEVVSITGAPWAGAASMIRMIRINATTRDIEFPTGETHRFVRENSLWRLKQMHDRFGNFVNISYIYAPADNRQEIQWTITDSANRTHYVHLDPYPSMADGWSRGQQVRDVDVQAFNGARAVYQFSYSTYGDAATCPGGAPSSIKNIPALTTVTQPDSSTFTFNYAGTCRAEYALKKLKLPTGGTIAYSYAGYNFAEENVCDNPPTPVAGVGSRTVSDGDSTRVWTYVPQRGPNVPVTWASPDPCQLYVPNPNLPSGPYYWSRTSVLAPADDVGRRTRTDNYFNIFRFGGLSPVAPLTNPFPMPGVYGASGSSGVPPPAAAKGPLAPEFYPADVSGYDGELTGVAPGVNAGRFLATQVYSDCDAAGDCTNGVLRRTTYHAHEGGEGAFRLWSSRTVFNDDPQCAGGCFTKTTASDDNGAGHFRKSVTEGSFPALQSATDRIEMQTWTSGDLVNIAKPWITGMYTEKSRTENGVVAKEQFCFEASTGALLRRRVLAATAPGTHDILILFHITAGNVDLISAYGGDLQTLDTGTDLCVVPLPTVPPEYKVENTYTNGVLDSSRHYDRATGQTLSFFDLKRTIDASTGVAKTASDSAGVSTTYDYTAVLARLTGITPSGGAAQNFTYTNTVGEAGVSGYSGAKVEALTGSTTGSIRNHIAFDGLGRIIRESSLQGTEWVATETAYDEMGRVKWKSEPESTGANPPTGHLTAAHKTTIKYDAFGRVIETTTPDAAVVKTAYTGMRQARRNTCLSSPANCSQSVWNSTETYDSSGRLVAVEEPSGPTTSTSTTGASVRTDYSYDLVGHLTSVKMSGTEALQNRVFGYDGRGFLDWESHPESGMTAYTHDSRGNVLTKTVGAAKSLFDLKYTYDSAGRLIQVDGRNAFYDPGSNVPDNQQEYHILKQFTFAPDNDTTVTPTDYRRGKLWKAVRYNWGPQAAGGDSYLSDTIRVTETNGYQDAGGRRTSRTTKIDKTSSVASGYWSGLRSIEQSIAYNDLGLPQHINYPVCVGCGSPMTDPPPRDLQPSYSQGRLVAIPDFVTSVTYWPNGMRNTLLHSNQIADVQTLDSSGMGRPASLSAGLYNACVAPAFTSEPTGGVIDANHTSVTMTAAASGGPFTYQWFAETPYFQEIPGATSASYTASPSTTTRYKVMLTNACRNVVSRTMTVSVNQCLAPTISFDYQPWTRNADGTVVLKATTAGTEPQTVTWYRSADNAVVGSGRTVNVGLVAATTQFYVTVVNACSSQSATMTVYAPLPMFTSGLLATKSASAQITVTWPAVSGAAKYEIERRSGSGWLPIAERTGTQFIDDNLALNKTYAYRIYALDAANGSRSLYSNADAATTMTFTPVTVGTPVAAADFDQLLVAVNAIRAAAGWAAVSWGDIVTPDGGLPAPGVNITGLHIVTLRARMNEALQALGVPAFGYSDPDPQLKAIRAVHVNELQQRAQ